MSSATSVLFDVPGPRSRRRIRTANVIAAVLLAALLALLASRLGERGQLEPHRWAAALDADAWTDYYLPGLQFTLQAAGFAVVTSVAFGLVFGTILSMIGVLAGCFGGYWISRALGRETVMRLLGSHAEAIESRLTNGGFYAVCTLRLLPGFPYWPVNYGSGALGIRSRTFLIATVVSALPGQLSLVAVGAFIGHPGIVNGIAVAISWALVIVLTILTFRRWKSTQKAPAHPDDALEQADPDEQNGSTRPDDED